MPNHFHVILYFLEEKFDLNKVIGNGKRFIAYEIIKRLKESNKLELLNQLKNAVSEGERIKGQKHRVFEESFDAKPIYNDSFLTQKLEYIHLNPVRGKWSLVDDFALYEHSSSAFYELGKSKAFEPVHYKNV